MSVTILIGLVCRNTEKHLDGAIFTSVFRCGKTKTVLGVGDGEHVPDLLDSKSI